jgi:plastocyanin
VRKATKIAGFVFIVSLLVAGCGGGGSSGRDSSGAGPTANDSATTTAATQAPAEAGSAAGIPAPGPGSSPDITVKNLIFRPSPDQVTLGTKVTWTNADSFKHTVTSGVRGKPDGKFDTELTLKGATFGFTFKEPGTFPYFCSIHSGTEGEITVK